MARISSGLGIGVAEGMIVGDAVWVGASVGEGKAVDVGDAAGVGEEAAWPDPHAERIKEIKTTTELQVSTLLIFIIHLCVL
jgi:hypothetical protein